MFSIVSRIPSNTDFSVVYPPPNAGSTACGPAPAQAGTTTPTGGQTALVANMRALLLRFINRTQGPAAIFCQIFVV